MADSQSSKTRKSASRNGGYENGYGYGGGFQWLCCLKAWFAELITCYSLAVIAVPASVLFFQYTGAHLTPFDYSWAFTVITIVSGLLFRNFAWFISPHIALQALWNMWRRGTMTGGDFWMTTIVSWFGSGGGWFLGAFTIWGIHDGNLHPIASLSNIDSFGVIFFYNIVGMVLQCHLYTLATSKQEWSWKILGMGLLQGVLIERFAPIVGGFFNLWASLAFMLVFDNWGSTQFWAILLATFLAPFITAIFTSTLFRMPSTIDEED